MRKYIFFINQFLLFLIRSIFYFAGNNSECVVCGGKTFIYPICNDCDKNKFRIYNISNSNCLVCGKKLISEKGFCTTCREEPLLKSTDGVFPLFSYRLWNINLLCRWKLNEERALSIFFSSKLNEKLLQIKKNITILLSFQFLQDQIR